MASVTSVTAEPAAIARGGSSTIVPKISNPESVATVTVTLDGASGTAPIGIHETLTYSVNVEDRAKPGHVVATVDQGGTLTVGTNGTFIFVAS